MIIDAFASLKQTEYRERTRIPLRRRGHIGTRRRGKMRNTKPERCSRLVIGDVNPYRHRQGRPQGDESLGGSLAHKCKKCLMGLTLICIRARYLSTVSWPVTCLPRLRPAKQDGNPNCCRFRGQSMEKHDICAIYLAFACRRQVRSRIYLYRNMIKINLKN